MPPAAQNLAPTARIGAPPMATARPKQKAPQRQHSAATRELIKAQREQAADLAAPKAQRKRRITVMLAQDGGPAVPMTFRAPRVQIDTTMTAPDGRTYPVPPRAVHANVVETLAKRQPRITDQHVKASARLQGDFRLIEGGIGPSVADLLDRSISAHSPGGGGPDAAVLAQIHAHDRVARALAYIGDAEDVIMHVVLLNIDVSAWARARGWDRKMAVGYLIGGLDRLAEFYAGGKRVAKVFRGREHQA